MKYWLIILFISVLASACQEEEIHLYLGKDYVQFEKERNRTFSFITAGSTVKRDTVWLPAFCSGSLGKAGRTFRLRQIPEYAFKYRYDEMGELQDSVLVKMPNQAEPGIHYVGFDDPGYKDLFIVRADSVGFHVPVILLRDLSLKTKAKTLLIEFVENENFEPGDPMTKTARLVITDMLVYPEAWSNYITRPDVIGTSYYFGDYGKVKHQLMIDVTGKPWDNEFIDSLSVEEKLFYKNLVAKELARINAMREENGESPLMEDPDNPNSIVKFS